MPTCPQGSWLMWQVTVLASPAACHLREPPSDRSESGEGILVSVFRGRARIANVKYLYRVFHTDRQYADAPNGPRQNQTE
jgi:hypothetical protein